MYNEGSAEFNELITKSGGNALVSRLIFSDFTLENLKKLEYYGGSNNSDDIAIGTTNMAYLDVTALTDKVITNQEFLFEVGIELSDGTTEYAPMGYFTVQKPDSDEDSVSFRACDRMQKFEKPYFSALTYPTDSAKVVNELCTMCGVELATPITNPITITDKLEGYTCREVLGFIAGIHGYFACFDRYGKLNLRWYSETPIEKQIGLIWSLTKAQSNYRIEKITLAKDSETTYTSGTGISGINHSNPYATQAIADSVFAKLNGFAYRPCEISMLDDIRLDPWDALNVTYLDGSVLTIPVMSLSHSFTNGETKVKSFGKTDTENKYSYSGPVTQAMERMSTELLVANRVIATKVDADWVNAHTVTADKLEATNARVGYLETNALTAETADLRYATITNLNAQTARIEDLEATALTADSAIITDLQTDKLNTSDLSAEVAKLGYLTADSADLKYANITLGNIDTANIDVANIGLLFAKVGLIDRATIVDGHITGFLDAVEINANSITAGTLIADRILLKGSENGLLYALNNLGELTSTAVDTLDGTILTQRTVTADKLVANSITANELDVTNIFGNSAVLNTLTSQTAFINAISTNSVVVGIKNTVDNMSVGGTNLLLATKNFGKTSATNGNWSMSTDDDGFTVASRTGNGNWNAILTITDIDATNNAQSGNQVVITIDAKADDLATSPKNYLISCEIYGSNDGFKTWVRQIYTNCYSDGSGGNLKYLSGTRENNKWCTLSFTVTLDKLTSGAWGTYNEYRYGVAVYTTNKNTGHTIYVRKFKMSFGNVPSDWSPAPEDISVENVYTPNTTTIDGGKITTGSIKAAQIDVNNLFAQEITAKGSITGATLYGTYAEIDSGYVGGWKIGNGRLYSYLLAPTIYGIQYTDSSDSTPIIYGFQLGEIPNALSYEITGVVGTKYGISTFRGENAYYQKDTDDYTAETSQGVMIYEDGIGVLANSAADAIKVVEYDWTTASKTGYEARLQTRILGLLGGGAGTRIRSGSAYFFDSLEENTTTINYNGISTDGSITSVGDVIAGLGTDNQVSMLSLNNNLTNKANKNWTLLYDSDYIKWTGYKTITVSNFGSYSEMLFVPEWYMNPYSSIILPVNSFKSRKGTGNRLIMAPAGHALEVYYVSDTQIAVYDSEGTYDRLEIFVR